MILSFSILFLYDLRYGNITEQNAAQTKELNNCAWLNILKFLYSRFQMPPGTRNLQRTPWILLGYIFKLD